jgi:hypothetical protein
LFRTAAQPGNPMIESKLRPSLPFPPCRGTVGVVT